jgi:hypothetical protein
MISTALQGATTAKSFQDRATAGERESNGLRAEVNQMASALSSLREEIKNTEKITQKKLLEASVASALLKDENEKIQNLLEESKKNLSLKDSKLNVEHFELEKRLKEREKEFEKNVLERKEAGKVAIEIMNLEHTNTLEKMKISNENNERLALERESILKVIQLNYLHIEILICT